MRVRADGFSKSAATPLPSRTCGTSAGVSFHCIAWSSSAASAPGPRSSTSRKDLLILSALVGDGGGDDGGGFVDLGVGHEQRRREAERARGHRVEDETRIE